MLRSLVVSRFVKILFYVRLRLCYCYSALCLKLIQTWGTLVFTGKDDNVSGFSECEIRDVGDTCGCEAACLPTDSVTGEHALAALSLRPDRITQ